MENLTPVGSLTGGILIGLSASVMLLFNGKIAEISRIVAGCSARRRMTGSGGLPSWPAWSQAGLLKLFSPQAFEIGI